MLKTIIRKAKTFWEDPKAVQKKYTRPRYEKKKSSAQRHSVTKKDQVREKKSSAQRHSVTKKDQERRKKTSQKKQKTSQEYFDEMLTFIHIFDVNKLKIDDEYIWPYLRNRIWVQLYAAGHGKHAKKTMLPESLQKGTNKNVPFYLRDKFKHLYNALEISDIEKNDTKIDFLFLTVVNAAEQVELDDGRIYHRITDPIYEIALELGTAKKIELVKINSQAIKKSKRYYHKSQLILPPYMHKSGYSEKLDYHYKFLNLLKKSIPSLPHSHELIDKVVDWELHTRDYLIDLLKRLNPRFLFLNGFHHQAPLISAADHLGIKTIDIQHGIQVGWNPLYNHWPEIPKEGYQSLPDYFFVWGEKEYHSIKKVFNGAKHKAVIAGFPWLEKQIEITEKLENKYIKKFKKYHTVTLLVLQNQTEIPELYRELVMHSPEDHLWIVRHHPKGNKFNKEDFYTQPASSKEELTEEIKKVETPIDKILAEATSPLATEFPSENITETKSSKLGEILQTVKKKADGIDKIIRHDNLLISNYFDKITLAQLFDHIDIVISAGSTVAMEADYKGLYNFIFSEKGKGNYIEEIENEQFFYIENYQEFYTITDTLDMSKKESRVKAYTQIDIKGILQNLMNEECSQS